MVRFAPDRNRMADRDEQRDGPRAAVPGPSARGRRNGVRGQKRTDLAILADAAVRMKAMLRV